MTLQITRPRSARGVIQARVIRARAAPWERHVLWLLASFPFAFAVPFVLADTLDLNRDLFYGLYACAVGCFVTAWAMSTGFARRDLVHNWRWGLAFGALGAAATTFIVVRTEDAADRPGSLELIAAILWRGVLYGATDGVLLSVFPILAVFAAFGGTQLRKKKAGKAAIATIAMLASIGITAVYHLGYSDFRSEKVQKPIVGAVVHSYDTDTFLPPHETP